MKPQIYHSHKKSTKSTMVQTFATHLHVRQDTPALDFKVDFITDS